MGFSGALSRTVTLLASGLLTSFWKLWGPLKGSGVLGALKQAEGCGGLCLDPDSYYGGWGSHPWGAGGASLNMK